MSLRRWLYLTLAFAVFAPLAFPQQLPYLDPKLSPAERAHDLVGRMTLDEKANQLEDWLPPFPASAFRLSDMDEALHGVARPAIRRLSAGIGMAATWTSIVHAMGNVISTEARAKYNQPSARAITASFMDLHSGRPTSTSFAIRAGAAVRKRTARIRFSPPRSA